MSCVTDNHCKVKTNRIKNSINLLMWGQFFLTVAFGYCFYSNNKVEQKETTVDDVSVLHGYYKECKDSGLYNSKHDCLEYVSERVKEERPDLFDKLNMFHIGEKKE